MSGEWEGKSQTWKKYLQKTFGKGLTTIRMAKIWNTDNTNACLNGEQQELSFTDGGNAKWYSTFRAS